MGESEISGGREETDGLPAARSCCQTLGLYLVLMMDVCVCFSGAGTSGGELEEESWQPPDPELIHKLVAQIEYYLSDENLEHDAFLLKHVRRNKLGFVSVKLLTSFKKVRSSSQRPHDLRDTVQILFRCHICSLCARLYSSVLKDDRYSLKFTVYKPNIDETRVNLKIVHLKIMYINVCIYNI